MNGDQELEAKIEAEVAKTVDTYKKREEVSRALSLWCPAAPLAVAGCVLALCMLCSPAAHLCFSLARVCMYIAYTLRFGMQIHPFVAVPLQIIKNKAKEKLQQAADSIAKLKADVTTTKKAYEKVSRHRSVVLSSCFSRFLVGSCSLVLRVPTSCTLCCVVAVVGCACSGPCLLPAATPPLSLSLPPAEALPWLTFSAQGCGSGEAEGRGCGQEAAGRPADRQPVAGKMPAFLDFIGSLSRFVRFCMI